MEKLRAAAQHALDLEDPIASASRLGELLEEYGEFDKVAIWGRQVVTSRLDGSDRIRWWRLYPASEAERSPDLELPSADFLAFVRERGASLMEDSQRRDGHIEGLCFDLGKSGICVCRKLLSKQRGHEILHLLTDFMHEVGEALMAKLKPSAPSTPAQQLGALPSVPTPATDRGTSGTARPSEQSNALAETDESVTHWAQDLEGATCLLDSKGVTLWASSKFQELTGYRQSTLIGRDPLQLLRGPATDPVALNRFVRSISQAQFGQERLTLLRADASMLDAIVLVLPVPGSSSPQSYRLLILTELGGVSEQNVDLEDRLRSQQDLLDSIPDLVFRVSKEGRYLAFECGDRNLLHLAESEFLGKTQHEVLPPDVANRLIEAAARCHAIGSETVVEYDLSTVGKGMRTFEAHCKPRANGESLFVVRDVTDRSEALRALQESERRWKLAEEATSDPIWDWDIGNDRFYVSPRFIEVFGLIAGSVPKNFQEWTKLIHVDDRLRVQAEIRDYFEGRSSYYYSEHRFVPRPGDVRWVINRGKAQFDASGKPVRMIGTYSDVSESQKARELLQSRGDRYKLLAENSTDLILILGPDDAIEFASSAAKSMLGWNPEDLIGRSIFELIHEADLRRSDDSLRDLIAGTSSSPVSYRHLRKDGTFLWVESTTRQVTEGTDYLGSLICVTRDISQRKDTELLLSRREEMFNRVLANAREIVISLSPGGVIQFASVGWSKALGHEVAQVIGKHVQELMHPDDVPKFWAFMKNRLLQTESMSELEFRLKSAQGDWHWLCATASVVDDDTGVPQIVVAVAQDITDRKWDDAMLSAQERRYRLLVESLGEAIFETDEIGRFTFLSQGWERLTGRSIDATLGTFLTHIIAEQDRQALVEAARSLLKGDRDYWSGETHLLDQDDRLRHVEYGFKLLRKSDSTPEGVLGTFRDLGEVRTSQHEVLRRSEYLRTIVAGSPLLLLEIRSGGSIVLAEGNVLHRLGFDSASLLGKTATQVFSDSDSMVKSIRRALRGGQFVSICEISEWVFEIRWIPQRDELGRVTTVIAVGTDVTSQQHAFLEKEHALAELARARDTEISIGASIQRSLLFGEPPRSVLDLDLAVLSLPSQRVDGDFFDFFLHRIDQLDIIVGDVMGKGISAALIGAGVKTAITRAISYLTTQEDPPKLPDPEEIVREVHANVTAELVHLESFITAVYARFDTTTGLVTFVDLGHTKTLHYRAEHGDFQFLSGDNVPLGFSESELYKQHQVEFGPGDIFVFYSDGLSEAAGPDGEMFGIQGLHEIVKENLTADPETLVRKLSRAVTQLVGTMELQDDYTCIVVKVRPKASPNVIGESLFDSDLRSLAAMRSAARISAKRTGLDYSAEDLYLFELAVNEAGSNIIKHAHRNLKEERIGLHAERDDEGVVVTLVHRGPFYEPDPELIPDFEAIPEGGYGNYIIRQSVDWVKYAHDGKGTNFVRLYKKPKGSK